MESLQVISVAALPPIRVIWEKVTVIQTQSVLETLSVEQTIVEQNIRRLVVTGIFLLIAVNVINTIYNLSVYNFYKGR